MVMECKVTARKSHYPKDVPFEVPEGWVWTEIAEISSSINYGVSESAKVTGKYRLLRITDIQDGKVSWESVPFTDYPEDKAKAFELSDGDILFARTGATVGKSYLVESAPNNAIFASYLIRVQYSHSVIPQYIKFFFESGYYWEQISSNSVGVGQPNVNGTSLGKLRIPLPPAAEQKRISEEAHRWMGVIDSLEFEAQHLSEDIGASKSRILNLAIHGKLVPQDPSDEPAIGLLKRINPNFKASDNLHYEGVIPDGWQICKLSDLFKVTMGQSPDGTSLNRSTGIEFHQGKICFTEKYLSESDIFTTSATKCAEPNSLLCCVRAPVGVFNITSRRICIGRGLCSLSPLDADVDIEYWFYALSSLTEYYESMATGSTFKAISGDIIRNTVIAVPPRMEQKRIFEQITRLFSVLKEFSDTI